MRRWCGGLPQTLVRQSSSAFTMQNSIYRVLILVYIGTAVRETVERINVVHSVGQMRGQRVALQQRVLDCLLFLPNACFMCVCVCVCVCMYVCMYLCMYIRVTS